eukprot:COSAG02_NODE_4762_length_5013_cov_5.204314_5_plen_97_part_00
MPANRNWSACGRVSSLISTWSDEHIVRLDRSICVCLCLPANRLMIDQAVAAANASDLTIALVGDSPSTCGEGTDRNYSVQQQSKSHRRIEATVSKI